MKCSECGNGRRFAAGSVYCRVYGMIIRKDHECRLKGAKQRDRDEDHGADIGEETGLPEDGSGFAGTVPGVLPGPGK